MLFLTTMKQLGFMPLEPNSRILKAFEKSKKQFQFDDVSIESAIELPEVTIISCKGNIGSLIGKNGIIISSIRKELNKKIRVVEHSKNNKKIIDDIIGNVRLLGVNEIFKPDGKTIRIIINKEDKEKLVTTPKNLQKVIEQLTNAKAEILFQ